MGLFPGCPSHTVTMALILEEDDFQYVLRIMNTNVEGKRKGMYALTAIKGIGRRFSNIVCKSADIDMNKRAGQLSNEEVERLMTVVQHPTQFKIPKWFLNRQKDLERLKKIRSHRGLRHAWGLRVRGQHTKTSGRR